MGRAAESICGEEAFLNGPRAHVVAVDVTPGFTRVFSNDVTGMLKLRNQA
jgi:hypothetical protein